MIRGNDNRAHHLAGRVDFFSITEYMYALCDALLFLDYFS